MAKKKNATAEIRRHWDRVANLDCFISSRPFPTIHHCHGGSMKSVQGFKNPGMGQKASDWLVIPLAFDYHTGDQGIDNGQARTASGETMTLKIWEEIFGTQVGMLDRVCRELGIDVWKKADIQRHIRGLQ